MVCRYLEKSSEEYWINAKTGEQRFVPESEREYSLCSWADDDPDGVAALAKAPRWMQRNALAGHLWREGDCDGCPCYKPAPPR